METIFLYLLDEAALWVPRLISVAVIIVLFLILAKVVKKIITSAAERLKFDANLTLLLARTSRVTIIVFGLITALGTLGVNVSALVAGLGLTGFALGFALKDTISNLISGVFILIHHPFQIGDKIKIAGFEGEVVSIDLRYTELKSETDKILIPNSKIFTDPITVIQQ